MFKFYITKTILYCVTKITNIMYNVQVLYNKNNIILCCTIGPLQVGADVSVLR